MKAIATRRLPPDSALQRASGRVHLAFRACPTGTAIDTHFDEGSGRARLIGRNHLGAAEAILINTSGGMTGGDKFVAEIELGPDSIVTVSSQAAERIYRRAAGTALIETRLSVGERASLDWLPQETIVFDRSAFRRGIEIDCAESGSVLAVEATVLGRAAMGETVRSAELHDGWRVRRAGQLVFADATRLFGDAASILAAGATGGGAAAFATLLLLAPDAMGRLPLARAAFAGGECDCGASAWNGMLFARLLAPSGQVLRRDLSRLIEALRGLPMPRTWNC